MCSITVTKLLVDEMRDCIRISAESALNAFLNTHLEQFKKLMYAFVMLLNLNVMLSPRSLNHPLEAALNHFNGKTPLPSNDAATLCLTLVLGGINFLGYFVIMVRQTATREPPTYFGSSTLPP